MHARSILLIAATGLVCFTARSQQYTLKNLGTLGGDYSAGFAVNNAGQVAGRSNLPTVKGLVRTHPFLYSNGTMIDLGTLGGDNGEASGINAQGHVTGDAEGPNGESHAFLWKNGTLLSLAPQIESYAGNVDANDDVVGLVGSPEAGATGVLFQNGGYQELQHGSFDRIYPSGISESGQIIGGTCFTGYSGPNRACQISNSSFHSFASGGKDSAGYAMNNAGDVCGYSSFASQTHATLWSNGSRIDLGTIPGGASSECVGVNDFGQEVGDASLPNAANLRAVLYDEVNGARDLNQITQHSSSVLLTQAFGVSNNGLIIALCLYNGSHTRACLLTPNSVFILKKNIFALEQGDPGCIQCRTVLDPEAKTLPNSLKDLTAEEQAHVRATVSLMIQQLERLKTLKEITAPQANLLEHQGFLVLDAVQAKR